MLKKPSIMKLIKGKRKQQNISTNSKVIMQHQAQR